MAVQMINKKIIIKRKAFPHLTHLGCFLCIQKRAEQKSKYNIAKGWHSNEKENLYPFLALKIHKFSLFFSLLSCVHFKHFSRLLEVFQINVDMTNDREVNFARKRGEIFLSVLTARVCFVHIFFYP